MNMITLRSLVLLAAAAVSLTASGQSPEVLKGDAITESALVEALTPAPAPVLTRSIDRNVAPTAAPKPAKAALLITFETNATVLTADAKRELDIVGRALNTSRLTGFNCVIEGHADPPSATCGFRRDAPKRSNSTWCRTRASARNGCRPSAKATANR